MKEKIPIPPLNLQQQIADVLELEFKFRNKVAKQISFTQEHRAIVITDTVTGQVDMRGIEVPDVAEDELLALEEDTVDGDGVIDDEGEIDETD